MAVRRICADDALGYIETGKVLEGFPTTPPRSYEPYRYEVRGCRIVYKRLLLFVHITQSTRPNQFGVSHLQTGNMIAVGATEQEAIDQAIYEINRVGPRNLKDIWYRHLYKPLDYLGEWPVTAIIKDPDGNVLRLTDPGAFQATPVMRDRRQRTQSKAIQLFMGKPKRGTRNKVSSNH